MLTQNPNINPLSLMPFGAKAAYVHTDINIFTDIISGSINTLLDYAPIGNSKQFYYSASYIDINGLRLAASVSTPSKYTVKNSTGMYLFLPFYGFADAIVDGKSGVSSADNNAFFSPEMARTGVTSDLAMVQASICDVRLASTAKSMVGEKGFKKFKNLITHPSYLPLDQKNHKFDHVFKRLFELIDDHDLDENFLKMLGIDDVFYRTLVLMLIDDDQYTNEIESDAAYSRSGIDRVAEFISVNYGEPITLTMLEQISGMPGKSLAKGFKKRFSCSPMQWLYKYRLDSFRQRLELGSSKETVTSIAYSCGFTRIGALSVRYSQVFGEKPSETLARSRYL